VVKIEKRCYARINDEDDISATSAVTAIWTTEWNELFAVDRDATIATISCRGMESDAINESCHVLPSYSLTAL
jgi:hypothetical protein